VSHNGRTQPLRNQSQPKKHETVRVQFVSWSLYRVHHVRDVCMFGRVWLLPRTMALFYLITHVYVQFRRKGQNDPGLASGDGTIIASMRQSQIPSFSRPSFTRGWRHLVLFFQRQSVPRFTEGLFTGLNKAEPSVEVLSGMIARIDRQIDALTVRILLFEHGDNGMQRGAAIPASLMPGINEKMNDPASITATWLVE